MAKKSDQAKVIIIFEEGVLPDVSISNFEKLTPGKLEKSFGLVSKKWAQLRAKAVHDRRIEERENV